MAISRDKAIIVGVVLLGGLSFLVYRQQQSDQKLGTAEGKTTLPDVKGPADLDKLEITSSKGPVTLEKRGETWMVTKPLEAQANQQSVKQLLDNLKELKATEIVSATPDDDVKKSYELDAEHAVHLVGYKGPEKKVDDVFGKSGARGEMMMVTGKPEVVAVSGYSSYLYAREAKEWRNHEIFKFEDTNAASLSIENKTGKFSFTKGDKWAGTLNGHPIADFDDSKVADAVRSMKFLVAEDFADGKTPADVGLDKPQATMTVALKDGAGTYTLLLGNVSSGSSHYAMKQGDATLVSVNPNVSGWAFADESKFAKTAPPDAGAKSASSKKP